MRSFSRIYASGLLAICLLCIASQAAGLDDLARSRRFDISNLKFEIVGVHLAVSRGPSDPFRQSIRCSRPGSARS